ncbi:DUF6768 family protein [Pseudoteredinibacter isoporae]|uniref:DUF6768 family protein n=1 Tax=Pseudoteredinibacter isoporae TaxID=570281 RepID=UPI003103F954
MDIDKKLREQLNKESEELDSLLRADRGLFGRIIDSYHSSMSFWIMYSLFFATLIGVAFCFCAYQFFNAGDIKDMLFWATLSLACMIVMAPLKLWLLNESGRQAVLREIKRLELRNEQKLAAIEHMLQNKNSE